MKRRKRRIIKRRRNYGRDIFDMGMGATGALIGLSIAGAMMKKL